MILENLFKCISMINIKQNKFNNIYQLLVQENKIWWRSAFEYNLKIAELKIWLKY